MHSQPDYIQVVMTTTPSSSPSSRTTRTCTDRPYTSRCTPQRSAAPRYDPSDFTIFKMYDPHRVETDALVRSLEDESAVAEVHRWRRLMTERAKLEHEMQRVLQSVHDTGMEQERIQSTWNRLNLLACLEFARQVRHPRRGRRS